MHSAHAHAEMLGLQDNSHALGSQVLLQPVGHLHHEVLLGLQVAGEQLYSAVHLQRALRSAGAGSLTLSVGMGGEGSGLHVLLSVRTASSLT
jgi:hypothetical protein